MIKGAQTFQSVFPRFDPPIMVLSVLHNQLCIYINLPVPTSLLPHCLLPGFSSYPIYPHLRHRASHPIHSFLAAISSLLYICYPVSLPLSIAPWLNLFCTGFLTFQFLIISILFPPNPQSPTFFLVSLSLSFPIPNLSRFSFHLGISPQSSHSQFSSYSPHCQLLGPASFSFSLSPSLPVSFAAFKCIGIFIFVFLSLNQLFC